MNRKTQILPTRVDVADTVRRAMYSRDPITRAEAAAALTSWGFPAGPVAIIMAAERDAALAGTA